LAVFSGSRTLNNFDPCRYGHRPGATNPDKSIYYKKLAGCRGWAIDASDSIIPGFVR
jgi:hypothetical protein